MPDKPDNDHPHDHHDAQTAAMDHGAAMAHETIDEIHAAGEKSAEAGREAARRTAKFAEDMTEKHRENFSEGMRALADAYAPLAEAGQDARRRMMETSSRVSESYAIAAEDSSDDLQALTSSYLQLGRGLLHLQKGYLDVVQQSFSDIQHRPHDLLSCRSVADLVDVQRDFYLSGINFMVQSSTALMELTGKAVKDAAEPLQSRMAEHA